MVWTALTNKEPSRRMNCYVLLAVVCVCLIVAPPVRAAFGGQPPLGPKDNLRRLFQPYDLVKLNYLGMNYCENLLDSRVNITSYTHLGSDSSTSDAYHLQFPDDVGRIIESIAWEDQFGAVARVEHARRLTKGLIAAHIPGTKAYHFFRHRSGGKTFVIFDDSASDGKGRVLLSKLGDSIESALKIGFRIERDGRWMEVDGFDFTDQPKGAGSPGVARSPEFWNTSPFVFRRHYSCNGAAVDFTGRYWLSDEDKPLEFGFESAAADRLQIVVGEPGKPIPMLRDGSAPGILHLPDGVTSFSSAETGDKTFDKPDFGFLLLRKQTAFASPGYSTGILIMWKDRPERIEALAENGYGQIRFTYPRADGKAAGRIWVYPFQWLDSNDMRYVLRGAEHFIEHGTLTLNGYPSPFLTNAAPAGLAAGACMLTKYKDPFAQTARIHAANAVDELLDAEDHGMKLARVFFAVKAAAWMVKIGNELGDQTLVSRYVPLVDRAMKRMLSPETGYDGKGWPSGWDHFNSARAAWLAYDATGNDDYLRAYERALAVYTIDANGIYRYGEKMAEPGGFETYFGSLPLALWGHAGEMDRVHSLIELDQPAGRQTPNTPLRDLWNDAGAGPWAQDDSTPEYTGFSLKGLNIPQRRKFVLPLGSFPRYDAAGNVEVTREPMLEDPYFPEGRDPLVVLLPDRPKPHRPVATLKLTPGSVAESRHLSGEAGKLENGARTCGQDEQVVYNLDMSGRAGAAVDLDIVGDGYRVDVSADGKRWYNRLDTWSEDLRKQSVDLSCFAGGRDELVRALVIAPPDDSAYLHSDVRTSVDEFQRRRISSDGSFTYKLSVPDATECRLEVMLGNGCAVSCSPDAKKWKRLIGPKDTSANPEEAWIRFVDAGGSLAPDGTLYVRFSGNGGFVRRLAVYAAFDWDRVMVRISNVEECGPHSFSLRGAVLRTWR